MIRAARLLLSLACVSLLAGAAWAQEPDAEGCKDPALFNRMPGYRIQRCEQRDFDAHEFKDVRGNAVSVEGHVSEIRYALTEGAKEAVVQALVASHGVAAARLESGGVGPYCPVASNEAEEGRAKNRRVELVKQ